MFHFTLTAASLKANCLYLVREDFHSKILDQQQLAQKNLEIAFAQAQIVQVVNVATRRHGLHRRHRFEDGFGRQLRVRLAVQRVVIITIEKPNCRRWFLWVK